MFEIINTAAEAYRGVIPKDCWHEPYMPTSELETGIVRGVNRRVHAIARAVHLLPPATWPDALIPIPSEVLEAMAAAAPLLKSVATVDETPAACPKLFNAPA